VTTITKVKGPLGQFKRVDEARTTSGQRAAALCHSLPSDRRSATPLPVRSTHPPLCTPALVLRSLPFGESDRIVTLLTARHGKIAALARGASSSRRRFGAALSPFGFGEATLRERRGQELWMLEELHVARGFARLPLELGRYGHACYACELCLHLCPPHEPEPVVLELVLALLGYLDGLPLESKPAPEVLRAFEIKLLAAVGLGVQLRDCAACGDEVSTLGTLPFDVARGGVLCPERCFLGPVPGHIGPLGGGLTEEVRGALLRLDALPTAAIANGGSADWPELRLPRPLQAACRDVLLSVLRHHLGRDLRAVEFIAKMNAVSAVSP
jgi:DNA repair protein RecO (recombination protein O)